MVYDNKTELGADVISALLPHRYPFLLLDRVTGLIPGKWAEGIKNVTFNEPVFCGHFPGRPIVPGVLLVESLAQLTAIMYCSACIPEEILKGENPERSTVLRRTAERVGYLAEIRNMKFGGIVQPGDTIRLQAVQKAQLEALLQIRVKAEVGRKTVAEGVISVSQRME